MKDRSNGLHKLTRKNYIKVQNQSSQKWLEWPIKQKNQTILIDFGQKIEFFFHFRFLGKNDLEKMFGDLLDRKESFLAYKNMHFR